MKSMTRAQKISQTMKDRHLDNFRVWREERRRNGAFGNSFELLSKTGDLAEYIGMVLGDGNISKFPRTERIIIACDSLKPKCIARYAKMTESIFGKKPAVSSVQGTNGTRISLYQQGIARRLGISSGSRSGLVWRLPRWISADKMMLRRFLRGLFEAEGSLCIHKPTYTYNLEFSNINQSLLTIVRKSLQLLGYHPEVRSYAVRLRRKLEVMRFIEEVQFRIY